jgi:hypothetical protein|tara:strand:+ start:306 stop:698 length:393 start_codon:yes stop_codon:yes gene_type:complete
MREKDNPIDSYISANAPKKEQCIIKVERTIHTWLITFPDGDDIELPTLKACEKIIWAFHKKAQFRDIDFILIDVNTGTIYTDHRKFTEYITACQERQRLTEANRKTRAIMKAVRITKTSKIDMRLYDRNY